MRSKCAIKKEMILMQKPLGSKDTSLRREGTQSRPDESTRGSGGRGDFAANAHWEHYERQQQEKREYLASVQNDINYTYMHHQHQVKLDLKVAYKQALDKLKSLPDNVHFDTSSTVDTIGKARDTLLSVATIAEKPVDFARSLNTLLQLDKQM